MPTRLAAEAYEIRYINDHELPRIHKSKAKLTDKRQDIIDKHGRKIAPVQKIISELDTQHIKKSREYSLALEDVKATHINNKQKVYDKIKDLLDQGHDVNTSPEVLSLKSELTKLDQNHEDHKNRLNSDWKDVTEVHKSRRKPYEDQMATLIDARKRELTPIEEKLNDLNLDEQECYRRLKSSSANPVAEILEDVIVNNVCPRCLEHLDHRTWSHPKFPEPVCGECRDDLDS